jgi:hypothetical protein
MSNSGGHWKNLSEAQKLTQSAKIPGVIEEDVKRNNPIEFFPVAQASGSGLKIEWLREKTVIENAVVEAAVGQQLVWTDDVEYTEVESTLRYIYIQRKLDKYVQGIYGTYNDFKAQVLIEMEKGLKRMLGDRLIYADTTYGGTPTQFDGLHALNAELGTPNAAAVVTYSDLNLDCATVGLGLSLLRRMVDAMKFGCDAIWVPSQIGLRFDSAYEEAGFLYAVSSNETHHFTLLTKGVNEIGQPVMYWAGIPIIKSDFMVAEQETTGTGATSDRRGKYSSGTRVYSVFGVRYGNVMERNPGVCYAFGGTEGAGDLYELVPFPVLEDYNAGGMRMNNYSTVLLGSTKCIGRITDITDAALTA